MIWLFVVLIGLCISTLFAFIHAHSKRIAREEYAASNARVLREFVRLSRNDPRCIVDNDGQSINNQRGIS